MKIKNLRKNKIIRFLSFILFSWIVISLILLLISSNLIFRNEYSKGPIHSLLEYEEVFLDYGDDEKLYIVQSFTKKSDKKVVVFFHGNAGIVGRIIDAIAPYYNVVVPSYPGYHLSSGNPSEEKMFKTVDLTMSYLKDMGIKRENVIVFGASLGGASALYAGVKYSDFKSVILVATFDSMSSICKELYSIFCIFSGGIFDNVKLARDLKDNKVRQFHSIHDDMINFNIGKNLFDDVASEDKKFYEIVGRHNDFDAVKIIEKSLEE